MLFLLLLQLKAKTPALTLLLRFHGQSFAFFSLFTDLIFALRKCYITSGVVDSLQSRMFAPSSRPQCH